MKTNISAIYWIIFLGLIFLLASFVLFEHFVNQLVPTSPLVKNFYDQPMNMLQLIVYVSCLAWVLFFILVNYLLIKRVPWAWYVSIIVTILNMLASLPGLFQKDLLIFFSLDMPWFFNVFYVIILFAVFMNFFTFYALIAERNLFFSRTK